MSGSNEETKRGLEPAFPTEEVRRNGYGDITERSTIPGLTKRELFAALAMAQLAPAYAQGGDFMEYHVAQGAVKVADALLKELAK